MHALKIVQMLVTRKLELEYNEYFSKVINFFIVNFKATLKIHTFYAQKLLKYGLV